MTDTVIQQNLLPNDLELKDLLDLYRKELLLNFNCHHIAKVQSFNPTNQTATATINYKKTFFNKNIKTGNYDPVLVDYPIVVDSPVICLGGGNGALTFPISQGDDCLVMFNDRAIDNWFQGSSTSAVNSPRLHSFSDGIILVGLRSQNNFLVNYNGTDTELRTKDGLTKLTIAGDGSKITATVGPTMELVLSADGTVTITNGVTELIAALNQLFLDIQAGTVVTGVGNNPLVMPTFAVDLAQFETFLSI